MDELTYHFDHLKVRPKGLEASAELAPLAWEQAFNNAQISEEELKLAYFHHLEKLLNASRVEDIFSDLLELEEQLKRSLKSSAIRQVWKIHQDLYRIIAPLLIRSSLEACMESADWELLKHHWVESLRVSLEELLYAAKKLK